MQAAEKQGLRAWFRPGRLWVGEINIPGNIGGVPNTSAKYIFQVIEWNSKVGAWIVSHAAHGDEQLCHLKIEEEEEREAEEGKDASGSGEGAGSGSGEGSGGGGDEGSASVSRLPPIDTLQKASRWCSERAARSACLVRWGAGRGLGREGGKAMVGGTTTARQSVMDPSGLK